MMASSIASAFRNSLFALWMVSAPAMWAQAPNADRVADRIIALERQLAQQQHTLRDFGGLLRYGSDNTELPPLAAGEERVIFLGDQITDFWGRGRDSVTAENGLPDKHWLNRGIAGQTTDQMLVRFRQDVISLAPKVVVIQGGLNDIAGLHGFATEEMVLDNLMSMTELAKANGIRVVIASVTPVCDCFKKSGRQRWQQRISEVNELLQKYCARSGAIYLDYYSAMIEGSKLDADKLNADKLNNDRSKNNNLKKELTVDGVIPNETGYGVMADLAKRAVARVLTK